MSELQKKKLVLKLIEKHQITAYEIGKHTNISALAAQNIINGVTKNPRNNTMDPILKYIEKKITGSAVPGHKNYYGYEVKEPETLYKTVSNYDLQQSLQQLEDKLTSKMDLLAKAAEVTVLNTDELIDITKKTRDSFKSLAATLIKK